MNKLRVVGCFLLVWWIISFVGSKGSAAQESNPTTKERGAAAADTQWFADLEKAKQVALGNGRPLMIVFR